MRSLIFFIILFAGIVSNNQAQTSKELAEAYQSNIPLNQEIVSGGYYADPPQDIEGSPYFKSKNFEFGSITINGLTYENVPLLYNIYLDDVITFHPIHKQKTLIKPDKVDDFLLPENIKFILVKDNPEYSHHGKGFYELVKDGEKSNLLCKHFKTIKSKREMSQYSFIFLDKLDYLIQKEGQIMEIKKKGQAIGFLSLDKKKINRKAKEKGLNYHSDTRGYLSFLVESYNQSGND